MFINLSNHLSSDWGLEQLEAASRWGNIYDIPFPVIPSDWGAADVALLVDVYRKKVKELLPSPDGISVVHIMGESVFVFMLVSLLLNEQYMVVASTTERIVSYDGDKKVSLFKFVRFRSYSNNDLEAIPIKTGA